MDDVELTFDAASATAFFEKLMGGADNFEKRMEGMSAGIAKSNSVAGMSFGKLIGKLGLVAGAVKGVQKLMAGMPEVGRTFSIVGDIMSRNLLWPLRQQVIPLLQKLLDWARENRAAMVRFGNVLANIFRAVVNIVKQIIDVLKNLWERLSSSIERVFGVTIGRMSDLANIAIFKLSAVFQYFMILLEPVVDFVAKVFEQALVYVKKFTEGFALGFGSLSEPLNDFLSQIGRVGSLLDGLISKGGSLNKVFKTFGYVVGVVVKGALNTVIQLMDSLVTGIESIINRVGYFNAWRKNNKSEMRRLEIEERTRNRTHDERAKQRWSRFGRETAAGGKELYRQLTVEPPAGNTKTATQNNTININVSEAQNAKDTAKQVDKAVRGSLNNQRIRAGVQ